MQLPIELLEGIALQLIAQECPLPPRCPPISEQAEIEEDWDEIDYVGQLWRSAASHPVRRLSQVCGALRRFLLQRIWQVVYIYDGNGLIEIERLYRYLRCVDSSAMATWTLALTYSNWMSHWDEIGGPADLGELLYGEMGNHLDT